MGKSEMVRWLKEENRKWDALMEEIGHGRMEQCGVNGDWTMKDMVAHMTGWNRKLLADLYAAARDEAEPEPPWGTELKAEDDINAWIYESDCSRSVSDVLDEANAVNREILSVIEGLPEDVKTEFIEPHFYLVWVGGTRFQPGEFFNHFHDDHEADVRAWLNRIGQA
jgi:hypothetical protein